jgi:hypothetical protein
MVAFVGQVATGDEDGRVIVDGSRWHLHPQGDEPAPPPGRVVGEVQGPGPEGRLPLVYQPHRHAEFRKLCLQRASVRTRSKGDCDDIVTQSELASLGEQRLDRFDAALDDGAVRGDDREARFPRSGVDPENTIRHLDFR